jgi:hypothetical protein
MHCSTTAHVLYPEGYLDDKSIALGMVCDLITHRAKLLLATGWGEGEGRVLVDQQSRACEGYLHHPGHLHTNAKRLNRLLEYAQASQVLQLNFLQLMLCCA